MAAIFSARVHSEINGIMWLRVSFLDCFIQIHSMFYFMSNKIVRNRSQTEKKNMSIIKLETMALKTWPGDNVTKFTTNTAETCMYLETKRKKLLNKTS